MLSLEGFAISHEVRFEKFLGALLDMESCGQRKRGFAMQEAGCCEAILLGLMEPRVGFVAHLA